VKKLIIASALSALLVVSGCAGHRTHDSAQGSQNKAAAAAPAPVAPPAPQLGQGLNIPSEQNVVESKEITRTISSEIPTIKSTQYKGDLNRMSETNFEVLGVPADVSQNIINYRTQNGGKIQSVDSLKSVPGMNDQIFNQIKDRVGVTN
jgi:DNA uptake protein ComE-like DNA-binding protein